MLGDYLRELRQKLGYSVRQFASRLAVSPGYVSRIETRGEIPSPDLLLKIAELLKVDPDEVLRLAKESQLAQAEKQIDERHASALALFRKEKR
jgi:transcriptional regulator with XRE-family HTH domain